MKNIRDADLIIDNIIMNHDLKWRKVSTGFARAADVWSSEAGCITGSHVFVHGTYHMLHGVKWQLVPAINQGPDFPLGLLQPSLSIYPAVQNRAPSLFMEHE